MTDLPIRSFGDELTDEAIDAMAELLLSALNGKDNKPNERDGDHSSQSSDERHSSNDSKHYAE